MGYLRTTLHTKPQPSTCTAGTAGKTSKSFLLCVQEPPLHQGRITNFDGSHTLLYDRSAKRPRAAIYASRDLNLWQVNEYTSDDLVTCLWKTGDTRIKEIYVASVYMDITFDTVWPPLLERLLAYCRRHEKEILLCADTNGHSSLWGSEETNKRGEALEELIFAHNLQVNNIGDHFTFYNKRAATIIDVTLSSSQTGELISNWKVNPAVQGSDHLLIDFSITLSNNTTRKTRQYYSGDWKLFQETMDEATPPLPKCWSHQHLELETKLFEEDLQRALDQSHPWKTLRNSVRAFRWWTNDLQGLKKDVKIAFSHFRKHRSEECYNKLKLARRLFSKATRRAKRQGWKSFCSEATDPAKVSLLNKVIEAREKHFLGILKKDNGTSCDTPEESIELLASVHFSGSQTHANAVEVEDAVCWVDNPEAAFITTEKVRESIRSFGDYKSPGPDNIPPIVLKHLGPMAIERLRCIFTASYLLGYLPKSWRHAKVVFIPKQGKKDYTQPRSFRPITLSCFLVKVMERIILWQLNETVLKEFPLNENQHAFRKGRSMESALVWLDILRLQLTAMDLLWESF